MRSLACSCVLALQPSLFDLASDLAAGASPAPLDHGVEHRDLAAGAWVELRRGWLTGGQLLTALAETVPWHEERRPMYDRVVSVPRLLAYYAEGEPLPHPLLERARAALDARYGTPSGQPLVTTGLCRYRDGRDSVAWHGDTIGRGAREDTVVAIVSLGASRRLLLRPVGGGPSIRWDLAHGDLIVMGGTCQRTWQHAVPKTARPVGTRISVQFRPSGVR